MEFVHVVKRYELFDLSFPYGFVPADDGSVVATYLDRIRRHGFFVERRHAELDSSLKQIIPYALVCAPAGVLVLRRLRAQAEARLHDKLSIGVGGHINPIDGATDVLEASLARELDEELHLPAEWTSKAIGVINDESNDVGSVHFGIVYRVDVPTDDVSVRENDKMDGTLTDPAELAKLHDTSPERFETWSELILRHRDAVLAPATSTA